MTEGLDKLFQKANATTSAALQLVMQPTVKAIDGLTATAHELEAKVTDLSESSARATQDILFLRQDLDGGGDLAELAALARRSEQAVITLMATTENNAQAIWDLRLELAGCTTLKETVDDIKNRQLHHIRDNIKNVGTEVTDMKNKYANLDTKYFDAFDAVNTRVDDILRDGIPPTPAQTTIPPSSPPAVDASIPTPANVVPTSAQPRDSMDGPPPDDIARNGVLAPDFLRADPIHLRLRNCTRWAARRNCTRWAARSLSDGAHSWTHGKHHVLMVRSNARHPPVTTIAAGHARS